MPGKYGILKVSLLCIGLIAVIIIGAATLESLFGGKRMGDISGRLWAKDKPGVDIETLYRRTNVMVFKLTDGATVCYFTDEGGMFCLAKWKLKKF